MSVKADEVSLNPKEVADILDCSVSTVYRYIAEGHLKAEKRPGKNGGWKILESSLNEFRGLCKERGEG